MFTFAKMIEKFIILASVHAFILSTVNGSQNRCIWYDICTYKGIRYNCYTEEPPKLLQNKTAEYFLGIRCPQLYPNSDVPVCCSPQQVMDMHRGFEKAEGIFGRCNTCKRNMLQSICAMNCAPDHSRFLEATVEKNDKGKKYVRKVKFRIDRNYTEAVYKSCAGIIHPPTGRPAMDLACGAYNAKTCNAERWYHFMGDPIINQMVPFKIDYDYENDEQTRFSASAVPCNEAYENSFPCSCMDCEKSCPAGNSTTEESSGFKIGEFNGIAFTVAIFVGFGGLVCVIAGSVIYRKPCINQIPKFFGGFEVINKFFSFIFRIWGTFCARNPILVLAVSSWLIGGLAYGVHFIKITTDPVDLWAAKTSQARIEKDYFDSHFQPFYRTNQIFIKPLKHDYILHNSSSGPIKFGPAFEKSFLTEVFKLQQEIENIGRSRGVGLEKICYAPMTYVGANATLTQCAVMSLFGYFNNSFNEFNKENEVEGYIENYLNVLDKCLASPMSIYCLAPYGGPVEPGIAVGGMPQPKSGEIADYHIANGVILTFLVRNQIDVNLLKPALEWEKEFVDFMKNYRNDKLDFAFSAERSIQDAIEELSEGETSTVVISYGVMFAYIAIALGKVSGLRNFLRGSRITLALGGILIVTASVVCSLGFFGYVGVPTTMLAIEVIPFLVLAVGVDNIFILVHAYNRLELSNYKSISEAIGEAVGQVGPSILQTAASEVACFAIGSLSDMPAVNTFAMYAAVAILLDFVFQITAFVALLSLDQNRFQKGRLDILCCIKTGTSVHKYDSKSGLLHQCVESIYAPFLLSRMVKPIVLIIFITWTSLSIITIPLIEPGLDQQLSMPVDSHVYKYFQSVGVVSVIFEYSAISCRIGELLRREHMIIMRELLKLWMKIAESNVENPTD